MAVQQDGEWRMCGYGQLTNSSGYGRVGSAAASAGVDGRQQGLQRLEREQVAQR